MPDDQIYMGQQAFPTEPGMVDSIKEAFLPTEQRAQLEAIRAMQRRSPRDIQNISAWMDLYQKTAGGK